MSSQPGGMLACEREDELLLALGRGFVGAELREHLAGCPACRELQLVAGALLDDRTAAVAEAPVPGAGTMWWRMQVRHRQDARALARRTLLVGQAVSLLAALVVMVALFGSEVAGTVRQLARSIDLGAPLFVAIVAVALLLPLGGWIAVRQK
jgi:predicted anti-sigma-YlaC factor YlaD